MSNGETVSEESPTKSSDEVDMKDRHALTEKFTRRQKTIKHYAKNEIDRFSEREDQKNKHITSIYTSVFSVLTTIISPMRYVQVWHNTLLSVKGRDERTTSRRGRGAMMVPEVPSL